MITLAIHHMSLFSIDSFVMKHKAILITLFIGAVSGVIAEMMIRGKGLGLIFTILLGIAGGWLGNLLFKDLLNLTQNDLVNNIIRSTSGALILAVLINLVIGHKNTKGYN